MKEPIWIERVNAIYGCQFMATPKKRRVSGCHGFPQFTQRLRNEAEIAQPKCNYVIGVKNKLRRPCIDTLLVHYINQKQLYLIILTTDETDFINYGADQDFQFLAKSGRFLTF